MKNFDSLTRFGKTSLALAAMLCVLPAASAQSTEKSFTEMVSKFTLLPAGEPESEMLAKAKLAVNFIQRMELAQANLAINEALQLAPRNSYLHFLNGFVYHLQAKQGDSQKNEMAIEGYQQALRIDPSNWIAQEFLGLAYLDYKKFDLAKAEFSQVLLMTPESTTSLYGMMVASYLTGDAVTACAMADQFKKASTEVHAGFARSSVSVYASCGEFDKADLMRQALSALSEDKTDVERVERRLLQWKSFYRTQEQLSPRADSHSAAGFIKTNLSAAKSDANPMQLAQALIVPHIQAPPDSTASSTTPTPGVLASLNAKPVIVTENLGNGSPRMVLVDVVLVSTQELVATSKGINLLNALTLQLGSVAGNVAAYSHVSSSNSVGDAAATISTAITRAVTVPALSYSLNIANANNSTNEVLARPTLAAMEGLPSEFFSGTNLECRGGIDQYPGWHDGGSH